MRTWLHRIGWLLLLLAAIGIIGTAGGNAAVRIHVLQTMGISNSASRAYNWWSGFAGSNILVLFTAGWVYYQHTCHHAGWDLRWGHPVEGTAYRACWKHHPGRHDEHKAKRHVGEAVMQEAWDRHRAAVRGHPMPDPEHPVPGAEPPAAA